MTAAVARAPDLTVESTADSYGLLLHLLSDRLPKGEPPVRLVGEELVRNACGRLWQTLERVRSTFRHHRTVSPYEAGGLLGNVAKAGRNFLYDVLRSPQDDYHRLVQLLTRACPTWRFPAAEPPLIHVVADHHRYFPWELLPVFDTQTTCVVADQWQLELACRAFPGFSAVVERRDPDCSDASPLLDGWERLPVRVVYNARYPGVRSELGFFRARSEQIQLRGPYPADAGNGHAPSLARQLTDPTIGVDGSAAGRPDQVVHIACHATDTAYCLADAQSQPLTIDLSDFTDELMRLWAGGANGDGPGPPKPLVFLNACGTAVLDPASAASLMKPFHDNRNRGVVGTFANVPDRVAAEVSRQFYCELLAGATVGEAIHLAKWWLLRERGNPLGLLYTLQAHPGMHVAPILTTNDIQRRTEAIDIAT